MGDINSPTYYWSTEYNPTTGLNRVIRVRGPDPAIAAARATNQRTLDTEAPPVAQTRRVRKDLLAKLTTEKAWERHQTKDGAAPTATQLVEWRHELGLSQRALATRAGVSRGTVAMVESGSLKAKDLLRRLGFALGKTEADW